MVSVAPPVSGSAAAPVASAVASAAGAESAAAPVASAAAPVASAAVPAVVADNKVSPTEGAELTERAKGLFEAIVNDKPELGEPFWFPKEPFIPLKDVKNPGRYWETLHKTYVSDIHALHRQRKSWAGATFVRFDRGSKPKWVKPGDEANKIGYHRSFHGSLRFEVDGKSESVDVHTVITWQGRWFITHLRKFKK
jgi:hypothetical protein